MRFALPAAYADPAFVRCAEEAIALPELVENFGRLHGVNLLTGRTPRTEDMRAFAEFVHDCIYMRLPDEAITALRLTAKV